MTMKTFLFDGEELTTAQIQLRVPCIKRKCILAHIHAGRNTKDAILCHFPKRAKPSGNSIIVIGKSGIIARQAPSNMR